MTDRSPEAETYASDYVFFTEALLGPEASDAEAAFIAEHLPPGALVGDFGSGYGRLSRRLARRGFPLVGVEMNDLMVEQARLWDARDGISVDYIWADARDVTLPTAVDAGLCWFTTFGLFGDAENLRLLRNMRANMRGDALFLIDVINKDFLIATHETWSIIELDDCFLIERHELDLEASRMHARQTIIRNGVRRYDFSLTLYERDGLAALLEAAGFRDVRDIAPPGPEPRPRLQFAATA